MGNIIIFTVIILIMLAINLLFSLPLKLFIIGTLMISLLTIITSTKKIGLYLIFSFAFLYFFIFFFAEEINILSVITAFLLIIYYINCFRYTFNLYNNAMNIQFSTIKIPNNKEYLLIKYIKGPLVDHNINGIVIKENNKYIIQTENKNNEVNQFDFSKDDIQSITIEEKPYMKSVTNYDSYEIDYMKSSNIGRITGDFDKSKGVKVIPSYEINIILNDSGTINIISFNKPTIFY